jgi:hypothetical protein
MNLLSTAVFLEPPFMSALGKKRCAVNNCKPLSKIIFFSSIAMSERIFEIVSSNLLSEKIRQVSA